MNKIRSIIKIFGDADKVREVIRNLESGSNKVDFDKIIPLGEEQKEIAMDDTTCACLNEFIAKLPEEKKGIYVKTLTFVGLTRNNPYEFRKMEKEELKPFEAKHGVENMLKHANDYLKHVENKSIFNGYLHRNALWGSGSRPFDIEVKENIIKFSTYYNAPIEIVKKLARDNPQLRFEYRIKTNEEECIIILSGDNVDVKNRVKVGDTLGFTLIKQNVLI